MRSKPNSSFHEACIMRESTVRIMIMFTASGTKRGCNYTYEMIYVTHLVAALLSTTLECIAHTVREGGSAIPEFQCALTVNAYIQTSAFDPTIPRPGSAAYKWLPRLTIE